MESVLIHPKHKTINMNTNKMSLVENKLKALHRDAQKDGLRVDKGIIKSIFRPIQPADFEHAYLPISAEQGQSIQQLILDNNCKNIVEFGTSFGISTIYLANAVRQTGGKVITTELLESKARKAQKNIDEAGLSEFVEVRVGDAMKTLKGHNEPIDFLFLDGWKDLYLPLYRMLEPQFHGGTMIYADNVDMADTRPYTNYVWSNKQKYNSKLIYHGKALLTNVA